MLCHVNGLVLAVTIVFNVALFIMLARGLMPLNLLMDASIRAGFGLGKVR